MRAPLPKVSKRIRWLRHDPEVAFGSISVKLQRSRAVISQGRAQLAKVGVVSWNLIVRSVFLGDLANL